MDDLISRDDVYNVLKKVNIREMPIYVFDKLWNGVRDLPSAEPERKWIPVSEALPEEGRYLVTRYDYVTKSSFIDILWFEKNTWWNRQITGNFSVLAWMQLPEPWRGE